MCRILDIACNQIIKNLDDPLVIDTFIVLLELYSKKTDNKIDDVLVEEIKKSLKH
jgi:hypothetical protein